MIRRLRVKNSVLASMLLGLVMGTVGVRPLAAQQDGHALRFFEPAGGALNDDTVVEDWNFEGYAGQVVSLIAQTVSGDLDPVLEVYGPDDELVATNDDLDSLVVDAGLEALALPEDGAYRVRVLRYDGAAGATRGSYRLTLTPGFAEVVRRETFETGSVSWVTPGGGPVALSGGWLRMPVETPGADLVALPPDEIELTDFYLQADARLFREPSYGEFGIVFRAQGPTPTQLSYYAFRANSRGQWTVIRHAPNGESTLRTWTTHPALDVGGVTLGVLARGEEFAFFADGQLLGTVTNDDLPGAGSFGVIASSDAAQADVPQAMFDNVVLTTRLGSTYRGLPLALTTWDSDNPAAITAELAESGLITLSATRDLFIPDKTITTEIVLDEDAHFELLGIETTLYDNFVMGATTSVNTTGETTACGVVFRWADERDFSMAYLDLLGGWGLVQSQAAELVANAYDRSPMIETDQGQLNDLLLIVQGDLVTLYINGALVAQEPVIAGVGRVGVALLNYEPAQTECSYFNVWVWPLAE